MPSHVHRMLLSIASALDFLHVPLNTNYDQSSKPGIAHRDLKTRNILLKRDGSCALVDFGLAVTTQDFESNKPPIKTLVGTKRYMAPEVLSQTISNRELTPFCKADIYSFGLVMWEVLRRAETNGERLCVYVCLSCVLTMFCLFVCLACVLTLFYLFVCLSCVLTMFCLFVCLFGLCFDSVLFVCLACVLTICLACGLTPFVLCSVSFNCLNPVFLDFYYIRTMV